MLWLSNALKITRADRLYNLTRICAAGGAFGVRLSLARLFPIILATADCDVCRRTGGWSCKVRIAHSARLWRSSPADLPVLPRSWGETCALLSTPARESERNRSR